MLYSPYLHVTQSNRHFRRYQCHAHDQTLRLGTAHRIPDSFSTGNRTKIDPKREIFGYNGVDRAKVVTVEHYDRHICCLCESTLLVCDGAETNHSKIDVVDEERSNGFVSPLVDTMLDCLTDRGCVI